MNFNQQAPFDWTRLWDVVDDNVRTTFPSTDGSNTRSTRGGGRGRQRLQPDEFADYWDNAMRAMGATFMNGPHQGGPPGRPPHSQPPPGSHPPSAGHRGSPPPPPSDHNSPPPPVNGGPADSPPRSPTPLTPVTPPEELPEYPGLPHEHRHHVPHPPHKPHVPHPPHEPHVPHHPPHDHHREGHGGKGKAPEHHRGSERPDEPGHPHHHDHRHHPGPHHGGFFGHPGRGRRRCRGGFGGGYLPGPRGPADFWKNAFTAYAGQFGGPTTEKSDSFQPQYEVFDKTDKVVVYVSLAGAKKENVDVAYEPAGHSLTISGVVTRPEEVDEEMFSMKTEGNRDVGFFSVKVQLPGFWGVVEDVKAKMEDGVLRVEVAKPADEDWEEVRKVRVE